MNQPSLILAIDQGTSSTKTLVFDANGTAIAKGSEPLDTHYGDDGFVEQDPEAIYHNVLLSVKQCLEQLAAKGFDKNDIGAIGISNQRETFVVWDESGRPLHPAVVWQCKRSVKICGQLKQQGLSGPVQDRTGLVIDPYFSGSKLVWLLQNNAAVREAIQQKRAFFGTIDSWLLHRMTGGREYATDYTNASRTMLFNIHTLAWDDALINAYGLTGIRLPEPKPSSALFGTTHLDGLLTKPVPVTALIGDSHAAAFGEGCYEPGTAKATLGTGCSLLMNIGSRPVRSGNGMVTTICWSVEGRVDYALEGVIVSCGATIEWLKNELGLFAESRETAAMARSVANNGGVYLIPAFSGLGSPHWQMDRRASISGLSFGSTRQHIVRAALESIPFQVMDVIGAMEADGGVELKQLMCDGGMTSNEFVMQSIADILYKKVATIGMPDVSAMGAAYMAGLKAGVYESIPALKQLNREVTHYTPGAGSASVLRDYREWLRIINSPAAY